MKIFIGADHRGFQLKKKVFAHLTALGHQVTDVGTSVEGVDCDYPPISKDVALRVVKTAGSRGILLCMTGIGHSIAANKVPGAYAALCYNTQAARFARQHNNANILVIGAKFVGEARILAIIDAWLTAEFEGGRHLRRTEQIKAIEREFLKS
jgi:RpiB/LacA/LacB family sugar-phosphate isomerase